MRTGSGAPKLATRKRLQLRNQHRGEGVFSRAFRCRFHQQTRKRTCFLDSRDNYQLITRTVRFEGLIQSRGRQTRESH